MSKSQRPSQMLLTLKNKQPNLGTNLTELTLQEHLNENYP